MLPVTKIRTNYAISFKTKSYLAFPDFKVISLQLIPKNGSPLFVKDTNRDENQAVNSAMKKMQSQIKKYKEMRFGKSRARRN